MSKQDEARKVIAAIKATVDGEVTTRDIAIFIAGFDAGQNGTISLVDLSFDDVCEYGFGD